MEARGPDVKLLLFAYAIFCLVAEVRTHIGLSNDGYRVNVLLVAYKYFSATSHNF